MDLALLPGAYAVARLDRDAEPPPLPDGHLVALVRDGTALTLVAPDEDGGWRALEATGPLDLSLTGVMASLATPLGEAGVPLFSVSSYDTDFILVPADRTEDGIAALEAAGHTVTR